MDQEGIPLSLLIVGLVGLKLAGRDDSWNWKSREVVSELVDYGLHGRLGFSFFSKLYRVCDGLKG